ncbi:MAG: hypothetical protein HOO90_01010 [Methylotenera sp.]|uniref:hypothetical protein n=1 Tax=Methylotenera sp. TaxID=2051956 RepID=UPI0017B60220|nr:hypothetical protein [Methylotenera sp.]NOU24095.1 hypothetical protein [Methylotenera sp.]
MYTISLDTGTDTWAWMKDANDESRYLGSAVGESDGWYGQHEISHELMQNASMWLLGFLRSKLDDEANVDGFDWDSLHRYGIELAKRLKAEIGETADVRYVKASKDPSYNREEGFEITYEGVVLPISRLQWCPV